MSLLQRVREVGRFPPSLLGDERNVGDSMFDACITMVLDTTPNSVSLGENVAEAFAKVLEVSVS